ncbi:RNA-directed DNA polymerase from mobile element jockey [Stylophora pistillata]|uniref:RNA-directed DNA polymerase from mobile element jockey n=1 Tax=Stylophora pistillata TaxID=50429 RepID=A0A2B4SFG0_STYPI|nr:RNA-directed DNA polymerase from mobile element jockey [Stylophora pistillata]
MGDLNLNKLRPGEKEGKILCDLEEVFDLECLIKEPTRITENSSTLLDVILTNQPQVFREGGVYNPEISDDHMVYASLKEKAVQHKNRILKVRSYENLDEEKFKEDLEMAPWQVGEGFESVDEQYEYWEALLNKIVDEHLPARDMKAIRNGEWIAKFKRGEWIAVYKKDDKQRDINYRPITVLPCVNKVYEVLLAQQVSKFMDDRLSDAITAYRAKKSCETTLIRMTETWRAELDKGMSTFGPLMKNIFQNDMPNIISDAYVSMYADDHQVFVANESTKIAEKILVDNGERMTKWYQDNRLKVNCDKYQAMFLGNLKGERNIDLDIGGEKVQQSQSIKILGVNLDENLNFRDHIRSVGKKVGGVIGILSRLKNLIPVNAKLLLYK